MALLVRQPLAKLTNLWHLNLRHNQIADISALSGLANLTRLDLQNNQILDIASLANNAEIGSGTYICWTSKLCKAEECALTSIHRTELTSLQSRISWSLLLQEQANQSPLRRTEI